MSCVRLLFEQRTCQRAARTAPVGPVCCTAAKTVPSRLSLISLGFFGSGSGLSPLSWAAAADYVEILCSPCRLRSPDPPPTAREAHFGVNSRVFTAGHAETAGQLRAPCRGRA